MKPALLLLGLGIPLAVLLLAVPDGRPPAVGEGAGDPPHGLLFSDGFDAAGSGGTLFQSGGGPWRGDQISHGANGYRLERGSDGNAYLRFQALPRSEPVSKSLIEAAPFHLPAGAGIWISMRLRVPRTASLADLFIADLECRSCWPDDARSGNPSPGVRLVLDGPDGAPAVERRKLGGGEETLRQPQRNAVGVPRNRWFAISWFVHLAEEGGRTQVLLDGDCVLDRGGRTLPDRAAFLARREVRLVEPLAYDRVQVGITANGSPDPMVLDLDDVAIHHGGPDPGCRPQDGEAGR